MDGAGKGWKELAIIGLLEAIGTAILFVSINFSFGNVIVVVTGILTGAVLSGKLTGAHFNAGVTLAVMITDDWKKIKPNLPLAGVMVLAQFVGGYFGSLFSLIELGSDKIAVLRPADPQ
jgi:glycerol uptake facilitator-like aquaporin